MDRWWEAVCERPEEVLFCRTGARGRNAGFTRLARLRALDLKNVVMAQFFHMVTENFQGVPVTDNRPPQWLNTDPDRSLCEEPVVPASPGSPREEGWPCRPGKERRAALRRSLSVFAVIHTLEQDGRKGRYRVAQVRDISATGIGLLLNAGEPESFKAGREFEVLFQFSEHAKPLHLACTACRRVMDDVGVIIGAVFRGPVPDLAGC